MGTFEQWLVAVGTAGMYFRYAWMASAVFLKFFKMSLPARVLAACRFIFHEGKPLYLTSLLVSAAKQAPSGEPSWLTALWLASMVWLYSVYRDADDDDRWKRRKKKLKDAVKALNGRLVVAPAGSGV